MYAIFLFSRNFLPILCNNTHKSLSNFLSKDVEYRVIVTISP